MLHHSMIKARKAATFTTDKLKYFLEEYMGKLFKVKLYFEIISFMFYNCRKKNKECNST